MTNKATTKPAPIKPATTTTMTRPKYYRTLDIFFYCYYLILFFLAPLVFIRLYVYNDSLEPSWAQFYEEIVFYTAIFTAILTFILIALAFTTKYNVMYTIIHHKLFKTSEK